MSETRRERPPFAIGLAIIAFAAIAIRIAFVVGVDPEVPALGDSSAYHLLARNLAEGDGYIRPYDDALLRRERATAEYPPLFPALLAAGDAVGLDSVRWQRILLSFVGGGTVVLIGLLGRRVGGPACGLLAAALAACYPMLFLSEGIAMAEALYVPLVTAVLLLTYRVVDDPSPRRAAALGAGLGLLTLTRAEGVLLAFVVAVTLVLRLRAFDLRRRVVTGAIAVVVAMLVVTPWTVRNAIRLHAFVPVSNNLATLVDGANCDTTYSGSQLGLWRETFSTEGDRARTLPQEQACFEGFDIGSDHFDEVDVANHHRNDGIKYAVHHLGSAPKVAAARWLRTWGLFAPRQQVNFESLEGRPRAWQWAGTIMYWVLLPLAVAGAVLCHRRKAAIWPMHASAITVSIVASLTYGQQRFRVGAEPVLLVLAAVAIVALAARVRHRAEPL